MTNANIFQIAKVQPHGVCLIFCQFQPGVTYKMLVIKKACTTKIDLDLDMDTNMLNIKCVSI